MIFCVERLRDFLQSFTQGASFFCGEFARFFLWRGCLIFFVKRLRGFFVERLRDFVCGEVA